MKKLLQKINRTPWFIFMSRFCLLSGILSAGLLLLHLARNGPGCFAAGIRITGSSQWNDVLLCSVFPFFWTAGLLLGLIRRELRRISLIFIAAGLALTILLASLGRLDVGWVFIVTGALPGFVSAFVTGWQAKAAAEWREKHPDPPLLAPPLSAAQFRKDCGPSVKSVGIKKRISDSLLPFPFLFMVILRLWISVRQSAARADTAALPLIGIGLLLYLAYLYLLYVLDRPLPPSLATGRFLWGVLLLIPVLVFSHFLQSGFTGSAFQALSLTWLMYSPRIPEQILAGAFFLFCLLGTLMTLIRRETRRAVLLALALQLQLLALIVGLVPFFRPLSDGILLLTDLLTLAAPLFAGICALCFEALFGPEIRGEWLRKHREKLQKRAEAARAKAAPAGSAGNLRPPAASKQTPAANPPAPNPAPVSSSPAVVRKPAAAAGKPAAAAEKPPAVKTVSPQPPSREEKLRKEKADYEQRCRTNERLRSMKAANLTAAELLPRAAERLYPGGEALASLDGQRQLLIWLTEGVSCLRKLRKHPAAVELMDAALPDDPAAFFPLLNRVVEEAAASLEMRIWEDERHWQNLSTEALVGGWFALNMYARMSSRPEIFQLAADGVSDYFGRQPARTAELRELAGGPAAEDLTAECGDQTEWSVP